MVQYASPAETDRVLAWDPQLMLRVRGADLYLSVDTLEFRPPPFPRPPVGV